MTPEDRAELHAAVIAAFTDENGETRTVAQAADEFDAFYAAATQAGREYAWELGDQWRRAGMRIWLKEQWKAERFRVPVNDKIRDRALNRAVRHADPATGRITYVHDSLLTASLDDLRSMMREELGRIEQAQANVAIYRRLIRLLEQTDSTFVSEALDRIGKSLEQYLADAEAGAA